jgi:hypothetical protein
MSIIGRPAKTTAGAIAASGPLHRIRRKRRHFERPFFDSKGARHQILLQTNPDCCATRSASRGLRVTMHSCVRYAASFVAFGIG